MYYLRFLYYLSLYQIKAKTQTACKSLSFITSCLHKEVTIYTTIYATIHAIAIPLNYSTQWLIKRWLKSNTAHYTIPLMVTIHIPISVGYM